MNNNPDRYLAEIYNAAWWIRNHRHTDEGRARRDQALQRIGLTVTAALANNTPPEIVLYAVADALYDPANPRFRR